MSKRFVVGIDEATKEEERLLRSYFHNLGSWWHWVPNFWLVIAFDDSVTDNSIRDQICTITNDKNCLVVEAGSGWAGFGPKDEEADGKDMFRWLRRTWARP